MTDKKVKKAAAACLLAAGVWAAHAKSVSEGKLTHPLLDLKVIRWFYDHSLGVYAVLLVTSILLGLLAIFLASRRTKEQMRSLLNSLVDTVMRTPEDFGDQEYRVTLFCFQRFSLSGTYQFWRKGKQWRAPWCGWLVGYARSGEEKLKGCTIFAAPVVTTQHSPALHGVAGAAWVRGRCSVDHLPRVDQGSTEAQKTRYAKATYRPRCELGRRLDEGRSLAPSIWAERIQLSKKRRWGVLVYDSVDPQPIISQAEMSGHKLGLQALSLVIEEGAR